MDMTQERRDKIMQSNRNFVDRLRRANPSFIKHLDALYASIHPEQKNDAALHIYAILRTAEKVGLTEKQGTIRQEDLVAIKRGPKTPFIMPEATVTN
jgi:hypothetical protein